MQDRTLSCGRERTRRLWSEWNLSVKATCAKSRRVRPRGHVVVLGSDCSQGVAWKQLITTFSGWGDVRRERPELDLLPSEYFQRQVYANYWFEQLEPWYLIGIDNILWEPITRIPPVCWAQKYPKPSPLDLPTPAESDRDAVLWQNTANHYGLT